MTIRCFLVCILLLCGATAAANATSLNKGDPWDPHHIENLPVEVRQYIRAICKGAPRAQHDFATYNPEQHRWRINLEYLDCDGLSRDYRRGNQCLDVDFIGFGSHYRLARKGYADCGF
ncbi:hypothetical protein [Bradyrhizobium sp. CER78]|uniref:hypothetical protein n=1 Tax=Bradyrhizobium sp. CER78 TaxID=3039162 RepID=UPI00244BE4D2|nr:hypothetical protein [Bradyrhizobium sp. CER78]MDH2384475.1 hypothetical protein [Bradyrhizobium sp. CER78]